VKADFPHFPLVRYPSLESPMPFLSLQNCLCGKRGKLAERPYAIGIGISHGVGNFGQSGKKSLSGRGAAG
jgi:hypothetical protein